MIFAGELIAFGAEIQSLRLQRQVADGLGTPPLVVPSLFPTRSNSASQIRVEPAEMNSAGSPKHSAGPERPTGGHGRRQLSLPLGKLSLGIGDPPRGPLRSIVEHPVCNQVPLRPIRPKLSPIHDVWGRFHSCGLT